MRFLARIFKPVPLPEILQDQLEEAEREHAQHLAAAEHHAALAGMYMGRAQRIRRTQTGTAELRAVK